MKVQFSSKIVQRKPWERKDAAGNVVGVVKYPEWYGRWKPEGGRWTWEKLYTDKRASEKKWEDFKRDKEQRAAGVITLEMDNAKKPVSEHFADYRDALALEHRDTDHQRISNWMLDKIIAGCGWKRVVDITADSLRKFIQERGVAGDSVSYQAKWITRAKAFVHWLQREGRIGVDPLAGVKRPNSAKAKKPRARRALTDAEFAALFNAAPETRRWKYAWPYLTGFRRGEMTELREGDLRLNAPIPFIQLRAEWTKNQKHDVLPLHPRLVEWLKAQVTGDDHRRIFDSAPDMKSVSKDLLAAGVATYTDDPKQGVSVGGGKYINIADAKGRRADFHALRHTYGTNLDRAGVSHATRKSLMRHADTDITDGYSHSRLAELADALKRLPFPSTAGAEAEVRTGTDDQNIANSRAGHGAGHGMPSSSHSAAQTGAARNLDAVELKDVDGVTSPEFYRAFREFALSLLNAQKTPAKVAKTRPSTQVV